MVSKVEPQIQAFTFHCEVDNFAAKVEKSCAYTAFELQSDHLSFLCRYLLTSVKVMQHFPLNLYGKELAHFNYTIYWVLGNEETSVGGKRFLGEEV